MSRKLSVLLMLSSVLLAVAGCDATKSANPLSPAVAGPIPGVNITPPTLVEPKGAKVPVDRQPVTLVVENAATNGQRPLSYVFEVATDADFSNTVWSRTGITPGEGRTTMRLPDPLATGRSYYWRARAEDGANTGPFSAPANFDIFTPIVIESPELVSPAPNAMVASLRPAFTFNNAARSGPVGPFAYVIEVSNTETFANYARLLACRRAAGKPDEHPVAARGTVRSLLVLARARLRPDDGGAVVEYPGVLDARAAAPAAAPPIPVRARARSATGRPAPRQPARPWSDACTRPSIRRGRKHGAFEVIKRVAWLLRGQGAGLLIKNGGENIVSWKGYSFSAARICYPDGHIYKLLSDVPTTNGPSWQDNGFVDPSLYLPAIDPR